MKIINLNFKNAKIIIPDIFEDDRGFFMESFSSKKFREFAEIEADLVQDNHCMSKSKNTLRGLHFQLNPKAQSKLVRCSRGAILDVIVDLKKDSSLEEQNNENTIISSGANGVHGIVQLNSQGEPLPLSSSISSGKDKYEDNVQHPKTQLLLIDGRISPALAPEMLLPLWEKRLIWHSLLRPFFCLLLKFLLGIMDVRRKI